MTERVRVVDAGGAAARDAATIAAGVPSRALMQRAGSAAAAEIARRYHRRLAHGAVVYAGPGNNGGDGWVIARALAATGVHVHVVQVGEPRTDDCRFECELARPVVHTARLDDAAGYGAAGLIVDAVLGTGARGEARGDAARAIDAMEARRTAGAVTVAVDVPSGLDATTGDYEAAVRADLTLTFGTLKRGLLVARGLSGRIAVLDIGLTPTPTNDGAPELFGGKQARGAVPPITAESHKGTRRRLAIVGGAQGMAGAAILAARAAMRSGIGMVRLVVAPESVAVVQGALPAALAHPWPRDEQQVADAVGRWADGVLIGPGLGDTSASRALVERVLRGSECPVVLDADALNVFRGEAAALGRLLDGRDALITPHPAETARLAGLEVAEVLARRFEIGAELARELNAAVLLKGVPTVISDGRGAPLVSAAGTPALAAAGSGDVLAGIAATLLTQCGRATAAGAAAAWVHGRAGEIATAWAGLRGAALDDVIGALPNAWRATEDRPRYPVLAELPAVGEW